QWSERNGDSSTGYSVILHTPHLTIAPARHYSYFNSPALSTNKIIFCLRNISLKHSQFMVIA
ncbi:hypothetical protein, partial [Vibrio owensii]|uniref:hypothetical protein n=1 Tax=Vibrio owensii TaxID=696485 RepID=UPI004069733A